MIHRPTLSILALVVLTALAGCVERRIHITSEPSGAAVTLNDVEVGRTPVEVDFTYFGTYDVRLRRDGYETLVAAREAEAPLHEQPVIDFFALLIPTTKRTLIEWHFELEPEQSDPAGIIERADALRQRLDPPATTQ